MAIHHSRGRRVHAEAARSARAALTVNESSAGYDAASAPASAPSSAEDPFEAPSGEEKPVEAWPPADVDIAPPPPPPPPPPPSTFGKSTSTKGNKGEGFGKGRKGKGKQANTLRYRSGEGKAEEIHLEKVHIADVKVDTCNAQVPVVGTKSVPSTGMFYQNDEDLYAEKARRQREQVAAAAPAMTTPARPAQDTGHAAASAAPAQAPARNAGPQAVTMDLDTSFYEADREFHDRFRLVNPRDVEGYRGTLGVRVWKAQRRDGWKDLVINCLHQYDCNGHRIACYNVGGDDVGVFPVPPGEEAFGPWLADKISRSEELTQLHLLDPTGSIFCSQNFGEEFVALKKYQNVQGHELQGILREIDVLRSFAHRHVVRLLDVFCSPTKSTLVFELMESNLKMYMRRNGPLSPDSVKSFMKQLMLGMEYVHSCGVMHRNLGPHKLLVGEGANLKIGGFGLSRRVTIPGGVYTHEVITVWYRPLEILLGDKTYSLSVDMWSCGCILGEMASNRPLFPGDSEIGVIFKIFQKLGTPTEQQWKGLENLPDFKRSFPKWSRTPLGTDQDLSAQLGREGLELLEGLLQYNPAERTSARTALKLDYLSS